MTSADQGPQPPKMLVMLGAPVCNDEAALADERARAAAPYTRAVESLRLTPVLLGWRIPIGSGNDTA
jgi:hypothetical protein